MQRPDISDSDDADEMAESVEAMVKGKTIEDDDDGDELFGFMGRKMSIMKNLEAITNRHYANQEIKKNQVMMEVKEALDEEQKIYVQYRKSIKKSMKKKKNNTNKVAPV